MNSSEQTNFKFRMEAMNLKGFFFNENEVSFNLNY